ncbi:hypothetical protein M2390_000326 [Mycetocola sp. BIGb0189]|nr:hypothetical protein [Mycetocola sp. BIGb0189]
MTDRLDHTQGVSASDAPSEREPLLVEDVLLLLFQPESGTIAEENILFYVLGGGVLGDLALTERVEMVTEGPLGAKLRAVGDASSTDEILAPALEYVTAKPRGVQTVLAAIGPTFRGAGARSPHRARRSEPRTNKNARHLPLDKAQPRQ